MILRIVFILVCLVFFINGCNSLISQYFGTHKLRSFSINEVLKEGIGDSDYVEISDAWLSGDFAYTHGKIKEESGLILYPVLSQAQLQAKQQGEKVQVQVIAWTADFHSPCVDEKNCIQAGSSTLKGVVRDLPQDRRKPELLQPMGYELADNVLYVNHDQAPLPWYWNAGMMLGAALIIYIVERRYVYLKEKQKKI
ncbi:MAG TPA: hypothetical protein PKA00_19700 [Saprospiraceae bacterium]|nr:hypothetical protein [Saprospiraceae bacterium]HMQ85144.1 hypothetical protein [Saprospiraceae bacterium]